MFGSEADTSFALKAVQKDSPFLILISAFCSFCVILGILLRMFEIVDPNQQPTYNYYTNGVWNIIVIMTTVGYGDYFPKTHLGRFIAVLAIVVGTLLTSLTIVALNGIVDFQNNEKQAFVLLHRFSLRKELHDTCQIIIKFNYFLFKLKKANNFQYKKLLDMIIYNKMIRILKDAASKKLFLLRELSRDNFSKDEDKFLDLKDRVDEEIMFINENFKLMDEYKLKLKFQLKQQSILISNTENSLKIFRNK
jgi:hypothetical protein